MSSAPPILDGDLLHAFAAFALTLNFTHAARAVGLSQPALFERIGRLAEQLGAALYEREGRTLRLTAAGTRVAAFAREELARASAFLGELHGEDRRQTVTLAAGEGAYLYLLGPALRAFARADPDTTLCLLTRGGKDSVSAVREGAAQLAVAAIDLVPDDLLAHDLLRTPLCVAVASDHRLARRKHVRLAELAGERLVLSPSGHAHRELVGHALAGLQPHAKPPLEADGWPLMIHFVALSLGVAIVNGLCKLPREVVARPVRELGSVTYRLLWRRGARLPPAAAALQARLLALAA